MPLAACVAAALLTSATHTFTLGTNDFLLDGKPLQMISGEIHPARVPEPYWRHRIQMAKAMGCTTIAAYIFWNFHEPTEGKFDFRSEGHNIAKFVRIAQEEGMWVLLRPGPYVCAEWDFGGIPPYLLKHPDLKVRCRDPRYLSAAKRYLMALGRQLSGLQVTKGGPILMVQVENEYGSFGNDREYLQELADTLHKAGFTVPFYTADGPTPYMLEAGSLPGCAVGLDSGSAEEHWTLARQMNPNVPIFSSETYPGWLTHWGEKWARPSVPELLTEVEWLLQNKKSFNFYVVHGGTNFGFSAGANSGGKGYEPDVTSYDYDAPISEQGTATPKYMALRELIGKHKSGPLPPVPAPIPSAGVAPITMRPLTSVWNELPAPKTSPQPLPFEAMGQNQGLVLYRTKLIGHKSGTLTLTALHDYAHVFVDGKFIGTLDRREGTFSLALPKPASKMPVLDILVEGMGHINFASQMIDRKGITDRVTLNGMTLMNWEMFCLPLSEGWVTSLKARASLDGRQGTFYQGEFELASPADTFLDVSAYGKGMVWVNGHCLGRYWNIGPQKRLYCPAPWLLAGRNEIRVLDLLPGGGGAIQGYPSME